MNKMEKCFRCIASGIKGLSWLSEIIAEVALLGLLLLVFHEVIVRYVFNSPTIFSVEISEYLLVLIAFTSIGWALKEDRHVRVLVIINLLPRKIQFFMDILTSVIVMVFCGILLWKGAKTAVMAYTGDYHSSSLLNFPLWIPYAFIPFGAFVLGAQYVVRIGDRVMALANVESDEISNATDQREA
jgi:TRAP-type C4-dicarboxylate transport system permease small subunit